MNDLMPMPAARGQIYLLISTDFTGENPMIHCTGFDLPALIDRARPLGWCVAACNIVFDGNAETAAPR